MYRNKIYVAFDGDRDMKYYDILKAWDANGDIEFNFNDVHEMTQSHDWAQPESIKRSLKYRMDNSKLFILLIGEHTKLLTKFVQYEVETAMRLELPIICVNLNNSRMEDNLSPKWFDDYLRIYIPFKKEIIKYAMDNWPNSFKQHKAKGDKGAYNYKDSVYSDLNL